MNHNPSAVRRHRGMDAIALRVLGVIGLAVALSGCFNTGMKTADEIPTDYRKRHPIAIREGEQVVQIFVGKSRGGLAAAQRADVVAFAQAWKRNATGGVIVEIPTGTPNQMAAADSVGEIRSLLTSAGIPAEGVAVASYQPADLNRLATIRLKYPRMVADAGPCGLWPNDLGPSMDRAYNENKPYWNLGCSQQRNLAAMVDNPTDLVQPRGEGPTYTPRRTFVMEKYRKGEDSSANYRDTDKAKISDVAK